jgi:hypothetical protein
MQAFWLAPENRLDGVVRFILTRDLRTLPTTQGSGGARNPARVMTATAQSIGCDL